MNRSQDIEPVECAVRDVVGLLAFGFCSTLLAVVVGAGVHWVGLLIALGALVGAALGAGFLMRLTAATVVERVRSGAERRRRLRSRRADRRAGTLSVADAASEGALSEPPAEETAPS